jgi:hypothetical protein
MDLDVVMASGELWASPDVVDVLALDRQGMSAANRLPLGEPSRGFLGGEGHPALGLASRPRSPTPLELVEQFVLLCHAICVTPSEERLAAPRTLWLG